MTPPQLLNGLVNIHKPAGCTSRDVVNRVLALTPRRTKAGHAGTLDPLARGVLVVCLGAATRLAIYVQDRPKTYQAKFLLGRRSDTEDVDGDVEMLPDPPIPTIAEIAAAAREWTGEVLQRPPAYSALRVGGRRAHELARDGVAVELAPRPVSIHRIEVLRYEYPELELRIHCGSGTYVRSLGRDMAESLGTAAVMSDLVREAIGEFSLEGAVPLEELSRDVVRERLRPLSEAVAHLPQVSLADEMLPRIACGELFTDEAMQCQPGAPSRDGDARAGIAPSGELVAVFKRLPQGWKPAVNFIGRS